MFGETLPKIQPPLEKQQVLRNNLKSLPSLIIAKKIIANFPAHFSIMTELQNNI